VPNRLVDKIGEQVAPFLVTANLFVLHMQPQWKLPIHIANYPPFNQEYSSDTRELEIVIECALHPMRCVMIQPWASDIDGFINAHFSGKLEQSGMQNGKVPDRVHCSFYGNVQLDQNG
jgi:hypothetical protein